MKEVYIIRHANWNNVDDELTKAAKTATVKHVKDFPAFVIVYASPFVRTQQTAEIISGIKPQISTAASILQAPPEIRQQILERRDSHPLGIAGALFENIKVRPALKAAGEGLRELIQQTLNELVSDERALIVSHDGTMSAVERVLTDNDFERPLERTYDELEGFVVDSDLNLRTLNIS